MVLDFSCSVRYRFASSHLRRGLFSSSMRVPVVVSFEEAVRDMDVRVVEEVERW
jgi:hypothetical protein